MNTGLVVAMALTRLPLRDHGSHQQCLPFHVLGKSNCTFNWQHVQLQRFTNLDSLAGKGTLDPVLAREASRGPLDQVSRNNTEFLIKAERCNSHMHLSNFILSLGLRKVQQTY